MFQAALHCNIDHTNHMEGVELYTLGAMDVMCQFCGATGFKSKKTNGQVSFGKLCCNGNKTHPGNSIKPHTDCFNCQNNSKCSVRYIFKATKQGAFESVLVHFLLMGLVLAHFGLIKFKTKVKYNSISNIPHLLSSPTSVPSVEVVLAHLVVISLSNCKFPIISNFCLIVDSRFHPSRALTRSFEVFTPSTWM